MMKKILGLVLVLSLTLCGLPFSSNSAVVEAFEFNNKTVEVIYAGDGLSHEKIEAIANFLADDSAENISTYGILCAFGHKLEYSDAVVIDHEYYAVSPLCRQTIYEVEVCTRESCSYINKTILDRTRISDCHG